MNRLSPEHLVKWRALYLTTQANFNRGTISEYDAMHSLMDLNFKDIALEVELLEFQRERSIWRLQNGKTV